MGLLPLAGRAVASSSPPTNPLRNTWAWWTYCDNHPGVMLILMLGLLIVSRFFSSSIEAVVFRDSSKRARGAAAGDNRLELR